MALIDDVAGVCKRLGRHGWKKLFAAHGLDISASDLAAELGRPLDGIDRSIAGFEDFAFEGRRGITRVGQRSASSTMALPRHG